MIKLTVSQRHKQFQQICGMIHNMWPLTGKRTLTLFRSTGKFQHFSNAFPTLSQQVTNGFSNTSNAPTNAFFNTIQRRHKIRNGLSIFPTHNNVQIREVEQQDLQFRTCKIVVSLWRGILFFHDLILEDSTQMVVWMQAAGFRGFSAAFWTVREKWRIVWNKLCQVGL